MINIIKEKYTEQEPYTIESYPYGRLRCKKRVWIESIKNKGDRLNEQTQNPKTLIWNKPKKSTYSAVMVLYFKENGYIDNLNLDFTTEEERYKNFIERVGEYCFNELQENQLKIMRAYIKTYKNVSFEIRAEPNRTQEEGEQHDKNQEEIKNKIQQSINYNYNKDEGVLND